MRVRAKKAQNDKNTTTLPVLYMKEVSDCLDSESKEVFKGALRDMKD